METLKNYLYEFCSESAPSGREQLLSSLERIVTPLCDKCYRDNAGNLVAVKYSKTPGAEKILLDAHVDEIGLVVTHIDDAGFVHFANHAGVDTAVLPASAVTVITDTVKLPGVVATLPPHLLKNVDTDKCYKASELVIDIGYSADKAKLLVKPGDFITLRSSCLDLKNDLVCGKSFDNRASASVLVKLLSVLAKVHAKYDVYVLFSAGEEFGGYGAKSAAFDIAPDKAIVLDATFATSPYTSSSKARAIGKGPVITISPVLDNHMTEALVGVARSHSIAYQTEVVGSRTGTNADSIIPTASGIPTALVSIPLRYMHSAGEVVSLADMQGAMHLVLGFIEQRGGAF